MIDLKLFDNVTSEEFLFMLEGLTEKEQMVLMTLRGEDGAGPRSYVEAGAELGMTPEEVSRTEARALQTLERMYSGWRQGRFVIVRKDGSREEF